jgi:replicative DNA helicase Mcm
METLLEGLHGDSNLRKAKFDMLVNDFIEKDEEEKSYFHECIQNDKPYILNMEKMASLDKLLVDYFLNYPVEFLSELKKSIKGSYLAQLLEIDEKTEFSVGVRNLPADRKISVGECSLTVNSDKLVEVKGIITHISLIKPTLVDVELKCQTCGENIQHHFDLYDPMQHNFYCPVCENKKFFEVDEDKTTKYNTQMITMTESYSFAVSPPKVDIWLVGDSLIDSPITERKRIIAGNQINVVGILHHVQTKESRTGFVPYLRVLSWETETQMVAITKQDEEKINELSKDPDILEKLVKSIAPSIYGCEAEKEAILVMLTEGNQVVKPDGTHRRGTIHIMFVGDPATAKTRLAEWVIRNWPKSQYAVGSEATAAGLSASLRHDKASGYWFIDPGALVMAHQSICVVDEMDKMKKEDMGPLDQVMEMQMLVINKAGINAKFPDSVGVLGILNPLKGRYDDMQSIDEQVNIRDSTLTRFDLKFLFRDKPEDQKDRGMLDVMTHPERFIPIIPTDTLIKYIMYAKTKFRPSLTPDAEEELKSFFLGLRKSYSQSKIMQITPRQYDALLRLSEAYAKLRLSDQVSIDDAKKAIKLIQSFITSFGMEQGVGINIDQAEGRASKKTLSEKDRMIEIFGELEAKVGKMVKIEDWVKACTDEGMNGDQVKTRYFALKRDGYFYEPKPNHMSRQ